MPVDESLTPRQLRTIADRVESLTKARHDNQAMGVPTTPDQFVCRFPSGHRGTVTWTEAPLTSVRARERNGGQAVHRYVVVLHTGKTDPGDTHTAEHGPEFVAHLTHGLGDGSPQAREALARIARAASK